MARQLLSSLTVGSVVQLKEDNVLVDFYVAQHDYEFELNGFGRTLLVRKDCYDMRPWRTTNHSAYAVCDLDAWFNGDYKNMLDVSIQAAMGTTKFYYTVGDNNKTVTTLERSAFALSMTELGKTHTYINEEGTVLPIASILQIAYINGVAEEQWTRSPDTGSYTNVWRLNPNGSISNTSPCASANGSRPAFTLPESLYINDDGTVTVAEKTPQTLGSKQTGRIVRLKVDGTMRDFIVVHQRKPGDMYDDSCDGTWLLMKDCLEAKRWHSSDVNDYSNSEVNSYLNSTVLSKFDKDIQANIKQVKIPYRPGSGKSGTVNSGASGLSVKIFLLSDREVGFTKSNVNQYICDDGAKLAYFTDGNGTSEKIGKFNGSAVYWWLRSPGLDNSTNAWYVGSNGGAGDGNRCSYTGRYLRPALILPSNLLTSDDGSVITNTAPTTPAAVTIPETIYGGKSVAVSWTASTDEQGNLEGYAVERSTDGGSSWTQIYQGGELSTTNTVAFGTESVMYRVRAYDSEGLYSGYRNSAQVIVINNTAPTAPGAITVPETVFGGSCVEISWTASMDGENNLAGYALERQADGGNWTEIFRGEALSFTDTLTKGWLSVAYRVRAYDSENAYSGYTASGTRTVDNNTPPAITCEQANGTDLGVKDEGFEIAYSVSDEEGDAITVTESIDGAVLRTFAAVDGAANSLRLDGLSFMKVLNGTHTLAITASDHKASAVHNLTFTKSVTGASVTLARPMTADAPISVCVLSVLGSIPADAKYSVMVTNNALDDEPVWEDCTDTVKNGANYIFTNETAVNGFAFNFKVEVERGESGQGGYINSVQGGFQ